MAFLWFKRRRNRELVQRLHSQIIMAARQPVFFLEYGVADTLEGRFELMVLHGSMTARHFSMLPLPGPDLARDLTDAIFVAFDDALRAIGISDTKMSKQMKRLTEAYMGRMTAYSQALSLEDDQAKAQALERALVKNVFGGGPGDAGRLKDYTLAMHVALSMVAMDGIAKDLPFPDAQMFKAQ